MASNKQDGDTSTKDRYGNQSEELGAMVDELLNDLTSRFNAVASEITAKMDDMSRRIDNLESSLQQQQSPNAKGKQES